MAELELSDARATVAELEPSWRAPRGRAGAATMAAVLARTTGPSWSAVRHRGRAGAVLARATVAELEPSDARATVAELGAATMAAVLARATVAELELSAVRASGAELELSAVRAPGRVGAVRRARHGAELELSYLFAVPPSPP